MADLSEWRIRQAFAVRLLHLVRTEKRELATDLVLAEAARLPRELIIPDPQDVQIGGWKLLIAGAVGAADDFAAKGKRLAAASIELVNRRYFGSDDGRYPQSDTICLEACFYEEPPGQRVRDCPRRMLSRLDDEGYRWRQLGAGRVKLSLEGVQGLATFQRQIGAYSKGSKDEREKAAFLADWLMWLRVEAAVDWAVVRHGLPCSLPIIFGVDQVSRPMESNECDYGPRGETLHFATENALPPDELERLIESKRAAEATKEKAFWDDLLDQYQTLLVDAARRRKREV